MDVPPVCVRAQMAFVDANVENSAVENRYIDEVEDEFVN